MSARFEADEVAMKQILHLDGWGSVLDKVAKRIARDAKADAPGKRVARSYVASTAVEDSEGWSATVKSDYPFAHLVEFGSVNNHPYRTLTRAARNFDGFEGEDA